MPATATSSAMPEPTADHEPAVVEEPEPKPQSQIAPELERNASDQVREPATSRVPVDLLAEYEGMMWSPTLSTAADLRRADFTMHSACFVTLLNKVCVPALPPTPTSSAYSE